MNPRLQRIVAVSLSALLWIPPASAEAATRRPVGRYRWNLTPRPSAPFLGGPPPGSKVFARQALAEVLQLVRPYTLLSSAGQGLRQIIEESRAIPPLFVQLKPLVAVLLRIH